MACLRNIISWCFGVVLMVLAAMYLWFVHPVPAMVCAAVSLLYLPPFSRRLQARINSRLLFLLQVAIGISIIWFTIGISDLAPVLGF